MSIVDIAKRAIKIPPVTRELDLKEYAPELDHVLHVWVNLTHEKHEEYKDTQVSIDKCAKEILAIADEQKALREQRKRSGDKPDASKKRALLDRRLEEANKQVEKCNDQLFAWLSEVWSQHPDAKTHVAPEEVRQFAETLQKDDEALWYWVTRQTYALILAHRSRISKN